MYTQKYHPFVFDSKKNLYNFIKWYIYSKNVRKFWKFWNNLVLSGKIADAMEFKGTHPYPKCVFPLVVGPRLIKFVDSWLQLQTNMKG